MSAQPRCDLVHRVLLAALLVLLSSSVGAAPLPWGSNPTVAPLAPSARLRASRQGASIQGALVDIRYGQVSIARSGTAQVLDLYSHSELTLNGRLSTEEELLSLLPDGLSVYVRYEADSGRIGWLDAISNSLKQRAISVNIDPYKGPAYAAGEQIRLSLTSNEIERLGLKSPNFFLPGLAHSLPTLTTANGVEAHLKFPPGLDYSHLKVFVTDEDQSFRGADLTIASTPPRIESYGPEVASARLPTLWGWVDHRSEANILDLRSGRFSCSPGSRIVENRTTPLRSTFKLEFDGPGTYWIDFEIFDQLGRRTSQRWPIYIRP